MFDAAIGILSDADACWCTDANVTGTDMRGRVAAMLNECIHAKKQCVSVY
jgi:hypothetical protein